MHSYFYVLANDKQIIAIAHNRNDADILIAEWCVLKYEGGMPISRVFQLGTNAEGLARGILENQMTTDKEDGYIYKLDKLRNEIRGQNADILRKLRTALDAAKAVPLATSCVIERLEDSIKLIENFKTN